MTGMPVGILGPTSLVADSLVPNLQQSYTVVPISRGSAINIADVEEKQPIIPLWVSLIPIWAIQNRFDLLVACSARRIVALSSTSVFTKTSSPDTAERTLAARIATSEKRFIAWAEAQGIEWVILRPTLIYGHGRDRNVSEIARFIRRFGFFPILGPAKGLRQPIRLEDVASACVAVLEAKSLKNCSYNLSGGEVLPYGEMVVRIFRALGKQPRLIKIPLWIFRVAIFGIRVLPRFRNWSSAMVERMNLDMVFDHTLAETDFGFLPSQFILQAEDLPQ